ncbi:MULTISPECIES: hypothetical protein [unclassified Siphonobacter]|uniref:DUF7709 family protein n=1 Tax=unclassified Siphonobacter TaxID=2635712 RepID=UPI000CC00D03|nr:MULTISPECIES: hypothetical protein [unclassified Siphonobacter]MDQ1088972.1 hypothetical protein [Siphonobacter sp. SORGH_AS_1065]MDR6195153.1 hypothetical protein [Siphonobacter sp. SORGH_AS_0500]PKK38333.1 hypothetical protein BWI96_00665 [Siphonobacter sp. SORGH_AS_0500]
MSEHVENIDELARINQKILAQGESLPTVQLKDGTTVQTGTIATLLHNINLYNLSKSEKIQHELKAAIPTLFKVGLFDLFPPAEWLNTNNEGRKFVGNAAIEYLQKLEN